MNVENWIVEFITKDGELDETEIDVEVDCPDKIADLVNTIFSIKEEMKIATITHMYCNGTEFVEV